MAFFASDLFHKRQRLLEARKPATSAFGGRGGDEAEQEYRQAEAEYLEAKAAFARAMKLYANSSNGGGKSGANS